MKLTKKEKIKMIHGCSFFETEGVERCAIPPLVMSDGPMGVRHELKKKVWEAAYETEDLVTYFPSNVALAATWNVDLAYASGKSLGAEARGRGKDIILAPGINIMRTPLCGRNFEYMSEDPCLVAKIAVPFIKGIQENDVAACVKHFALNNQEVRRSEVNVEVDERALREIYLQAFEACVKEADVYTLMSAYNKVRGEYCSHSQLLLDVILKNEWKFKGAVISDWAAVHDTKKAALCGLDIEMSTEPNFDDYYLANPLKKELETGSISEAEIDKKVERILYLMERIGKFKEDRNAGAYNHPLHRERALQVARESIVLLKNEDVLPLNRKTCGRIAVIGENAQKMHALGGGSAEIKALYEISPILGLKMEAGGNIQIEYARGYSAEDSESEILRKEAVELAKCCDTVVFIGGLNHDYDSEGLDKENLILPYQQDKLILALLKEKPDTIIAMVSGSPVEMHRFEPKAKAIVQSWYAGAEGGKALAEVIFGNVNPSGKLPITFPKYLSDSPAHAVGEYPGGDTVNYKEGIYVGYRYFEKENIAPQYPFGHGLSYSKFLFEKLETQTEKNSILLSVVIKNIGERMGKEVVQVYLSKPDNDIDMPKKELKSFAKVELKPREEQKIEFKLYERDMSYYDVSQKKWSIPKGKFVVSVGVSSEDIRLFAEIQYKQVL